MGDSVERWLSNLGLEQYAGLFADSHISTDELPDLTDDDLRELDVAPDCLLYTSPSPRDGLLSRMPSSA